MAKPKKSATRSKKPAAKVKKPAVKAKVKKPSVTAKKPLVKAKAKQPAVKAKQPAVKAKQPVKPKPAILAKPATKPKRAPVHAVTPEAAEQDASPPERAEAFVVPSRIVEPSQPQRAERPVHISEAAPRVALPSAGMPTGSSALAGTALTWRDSLRAAVPTTGADFATYLRSLGSESPWAFADTPELVGLERWGRELAQRDRVAGIAALVAAAHHGFPRAAEAGGSALDGMGFSGLDADPIHDGAAVEVQIARAMEWLDDPGPVSEERVDEAFDRTRQLNVWEDDLRPPEDSTFYWYLDVGQACCAAILDVGSDPNGASYYDWPTPVCVGRGLVMAARGLRGPHHGIAAVVNGLRKAMAA